LEAQEASRQQQQRSTPPDKQFLPHAKSGGTTGEEGPDWNKITMDDARKYNMARARGGVPMQENTEHGEFSGKQSLIQTDSGEGGGPEHKAQGFKTESVAQSVVRTLPGDPSKQSRWDVKSDSAASPDENLNYILDQMDREEYDPQKVAEFKKRAQALTSDQLRALVVEYE